MSCLTTFRRLQRAYRHRVMAYQWKRSLAKRQQWKDECDERSCPDCGNDWMGKPDCVCHRTVCTPSLLRRFLRRLAGINPGSDQHGPTGSLIPKSEWDDWSRGLPGPRKCSPEGWDLAVRAYEDGVNEGGG